MKLLLRRIARRPTYTIGKLYINGKYMCDVLEDTDRGLTQDMDEDEIRKRKVKGQTAIPTGIYNIIITYSPKYRKSMPLLLSVKGYEGIRIHSGNTDRDTEGCLLVGENRVVGQVINSRYTFNKLYPMLKKAFDKGETIKIEII